MRVLTALLLLVLLASVSSAPDQCEPTATNEQDCENLTTEYEKYRECMEHRISKRSLCDSPCNDCDCNSCNSSCNDEDDCTPNSCCNSCCEQRHQQCTTYSCCHKSCRADCRTSNCRSSCRRKCQSETTKYIDKSEKLTGGVSGLTSNINQTLKSDHNITTIIHLNNIINNTNLIHLPVNVNNTNVNNITVEANSAPGGAERIIYQQIPGVPGLPGLPGLPGVPGMPGTSSSSKISSGSSVSSSGSSENCCLTVGPKQCVRQKEFPFIKCYHIRKKTCGAMCTAPVVHYQKHEVCDNDIDNKQPCKEQIVYIPQPQPRCAYQETWPYVTCDGYQTPSCDGCYFNREEGGGNCSPFCYDDGYGMGMGMGGGYFRQGPVYRPGYSHVPSCVQTGTCGMEFGYGGGAAGYNLDSFNFAVEPVDSSQTPGDNPEKAVGIDSEVLFKNLPSKEELKKNQAEIKIVPEVVT